VKRKEQERPEGDASGLFVWTPGTVREAYREPPLYLMFRRMARPEWMRFFSSRFDANIVGGHFMCAEDAGEGRSTVDRNAGWPLGGNVIWKPRDDIGKRTGVERPTKKPSADEG